MKLENWYQESVVIRSLLNNSALAETDNMFQEGKQRAQVLRDEVKAAGADTALKLYSEGRKHNSQLEDALVVMPFAHTLDATEVEQLVQDLRGLGDVKRVYFAQNSLDCLAAFANAGCTLVGMDTVLEPYGGVFQPEYRRIPAMVIEIN